MTGKVLRKSGDKSVVVEVTSVSRHPMYGKKIVSTKRYMAHDPENKAEVGQAVVLKPTRPFSARKRFVLVGIEE